MNPMIRVVRNHRLEWEERRFFGLRCIRKITGKQAGVIDMKYVKFYKTLPPAGSVFYVPARAH